MGLGGAGMITFLASPKPFVGIADIHQRRAIASWKALHPDVEIFLYGTADGIEQCATEMGVNCVTDIETTELGTPYLNEIVDHGAHEGRHDTQAFVNCDIMLVDDLWATLKILPFKQYLLSNARVNLPESVDMDVTVPGWLDDLFALARAGQLHVSYGSDLFVYQRGLWAGAPKLIIGRAGIENGMFDYVLRCGVPLIDATESVLSLHPFHDYGHVEGGRDEIFKGPEKQLNYRVFGDFIPNVRDGAWMIKNGRLRHIWGEGNWVRATIVFIRYLLRCPRLARVLNMVLEFFQMRFAFSVVHEATPEEVLAHLAFSNRDYYLQVKSGNRKE